MANLKKNGLIISCQAVKGEPLYGYGIMHLMAKAAAEGGADGIRANYVSDINSIKQTVDLPVIGIIKAVYDGSPVFITPTQKELDALLTQTDCEVIAIDATHRERPNGEKLEDLVAYARKKKPEVELMADCATMEDAERAVRLGFDYIGTTLRGYTEETKGTQLPDIAFLKELTTKFPQAHIIAEGGIWERGQLEKVWETGVYTVVIGSSVTRPKDITKRFKEVCPR